MAYRFHESVASHGLQQWDQDYQAIPNFFKYSELFISYTYLHNDCGYLMQPQGAPENGYMWNRVSPQLSSPNQPYSLREALAQAQSSRIGSTARALRESLHPVLRQKLVCTSHIWYL